jgi:hypothetical protein
MLSDRARFRIFELRDDLRNLAIDGQISASSFEYRFLEKLLCRLAEKCVWFSWSSFIEFLWRNKDAELSPEAARFETEASEALKEIYFKAVMEMMKVMCTNSPIWTTFFGIASIIDYFSGRAWKKWLDFKAKVFLDEPLPDNIVPAT